MMMPLARRLLGAACALLLTSTITPSTDAAFYSPYGYCCNDAAYTSYYGGYGRSYGTYLTGYRGLSYSFYAPSYVAYGSTYCGSCCDPCGVSYGGFSCGTCGTGACCSGCGLTGCSGGCGLTGCVIASNCVSSGDCGTGLSPAVGTTEPKAAPNQQYSPPPTDKTYEPNTTGGTGGGGFEQPARRSNPAPAGQSNSGGDEVLPPTGGSGGGGDFGDFNGGGTFERGEANKVPAVVEEPIQQKTDHAPAAEGSGDSHQPADMEPTDENEEGETSETSREIDVRPADIKTQVASSLTAKRSRAHYSVRFLAPRVARLDVKPNSKWAPVDPDTKLAATK